MKATTTLKFNATPILQHILRSINKYHHASNSVALALSNQTAKTFVNNVAKAIRNDDCENANSYYFVTKSGAMALKILPTNLEDAIHQIVQADIIAVALFKVNKNDRFKYSLDILKKFNF